MTTIIEALFSGGRVSSGGISNTYELVKLCPAEFKKANTWSSYARKLFRLGGNIANWQWKLEDEIKRQHQFACFQAILVTFNLGSEDRWSIAGWMLSEMLSEFPEYIPIRK